MTGDRFPRDPETKMLVGPDGSHYETEQDVHHFAVLGMCGCGSPRGSYNFLREVLKLCDRRGCHDTPPTRAWINAEAAIAKLVAADPRLVAHVLLHFLTKRDVIEHGGSVGGSWLTPSGEAIVDAPAAQLEDDE